MTASVVFEAMAEACISNHEEILRHGSPEMQTASRMLLYALAADIVRRERAVAASHDDRVRDVTQGIRD